MKKNFKKAFTLVEMLIVVVIIGILSSALLPRLQGAQSAARDSARKSDLSQLGSAILQYYNNRGEYPEGTGGTTDATKGTNGYMISVDKIGDKLIKLVELSSVPHDPNKKNIITWKAWQNWSGITLSGWEYWYFMMQKNTIPNGWYVLVARTETEWGTNFLNSVPLSWDLSNLKTCTSLKSVDIDNCEETKSVDDIIAKNWECCYKSKDQFLYLYVF